MTGVTMRERTASTPAPNDGGRGRLRLSLLGGFELHAGDEAVELPASAQRLIAFLAIRGRPQQRVHVAGSLWLDVPEERANAALRTALWRSRTPDCPIVEARGPQLGLARAVEVDLHHAARCAQAVMAGSPAAAPELSGLDFVWTQGELLPDWYDDWVLIERERHRQLRLYALEALCAALTEARRYGEAAQAGIAAIAAEPLRESAHRALIRVHLAEANPCEALRQYRLFSQMLRDQLGLEPSAQLRELVALAVRVPAS